MKDYRNLSDQILLESTRQAVRFEREATTDVLYRLREVERRRLFVDLKYSSLFEYAIGDLRYGHSAAQRRIEAMRLLKELPELEEKIESGVLNLSVLTQAQRFFNQEAKAEKPLGAEKKREVLEVLEGKSTREVDLELISRATNPVALRRESVRVVSQTHSELRFLASQETLDQLQRIRGLLGHSHSTLSLAELVALMAKMTLEKLDPAREPKRKIAAKNADTKAQELVSAQIPPERRKHIPAGTRREVWKKAQGKCVGCGSIHRLQIDHIQPLAKGGTNTSQNLRLLCFHCNQRQADLKLGRGRMESFRAPPKDLPNENTNHSPVPSKAQARMPARANLPRQTLTCAGRERDASESPSNNQDAR